MEAILKAKTFQDVGREIWVHGYEQCHFTGQSQFAFFCMHRVWTSLPREKASHGFVCDYSESSCFLFKGRTVVRSFFSKGRTVVRPFFLRDVL